MKPQTYENNYKKMADWIRKRSIFYTILKFLYKVVPYPVALCYIWLLLIEYIEPSKAVFLRVFLVPLITVVVVSIVRKLFNRARPYTRYQIEPLIRKEKNGESFPSRHTVSVAIIAMAWTYVDWHVGLILWVVTIITAAVRVISGVHFLSDVIAGIIWALVFGVIGFWIL